MLTTPNHYLEGPRRDAEKDAQQIADFKQEVEDVVRIIKRGTAGQLRQIGAFLQYRRDRLVHRPEGLDSCTDRIEAIIQEHDDGLDANIADFLADFISEIESYTAEALDQREAS